MQQLELFPNDIVRFAVELPREALDKLKDARPEDYYRIRELRNLIHKHNGHVRHLEKRLAFDINSLINWR